MKEEEISAEELRRLSALGLAIDFCKDHPTEDREIEVVKIAKVFAEFLKGE